MATGVRQREEPQHQTLSPQLGGGNQEGQQVMGGVIFVRKHRQTQQTVANQGGRGGRGRQRERENLPEEYPLMRFDYGSSFCMRFPKSLLAL